MPDNLRWCRRGYHFKPEGEFYGSVRTECKSCFRERIRLRKGPLKSPPGSNARLMGLRYRIDPVDEDTRAANYARYEKEFELSSAFQEAQEE